MTQQERKEASINKILEAAQKCIQNSGIDSLDIEEVCIEAGLTKGAFYYHFRSKQHLLLELLNRWINHISSQIELPENKEIDTVELLFYIVERMSPVFKKTESQLPIFLELYVKAISDKDLKKYVLQSYRSFLTFFSNILKNGMKKGHIKTGDPVKISKILFSITIGLLIQGLIDPFGEDWEKLTKKSIRLLLSR